MGRLRLGHLGFGIHNSQHVMLSRRTQKAANWKCGREYLSVWNPTYLPHLLVEFKTADRHLCETGLHSLKPLG